MPAHCISPHRSAPLLHLIYLACILLLIAGCEGAAPQTLQATLTGTAQAVPTPGTQAEITFLAHLPAGLADGQSLYLEFLDEVTGLAMNPTRVKMVTTDQLNFGAKVPFQLGSVLKYRYVRDNDPIGVEYNSLAQQVRYRLYVVDGPGTVNDSITGWKAASVVPGLGRIRGQVANVTNNAPVVNALVAAGGLQTLTASDGSFLLEGLPQGTHNLVVYSLDGAFRPFQQGAVVGLDSTTPALIMLNPTSLVNITFHVHPPQENIKGVPIRLIGNQFTLGNTFADLKGGLNTLASRAPLLSIQKDGTYLLKLKLPAGLDLRYKYSLGDGFWNAEHTSNGEMRIRQVIIPNQDATFDDTVDTWKTNGYGTVSFKVTVPANTPVNDTISIQFNPFGWTESIPMWATGKNQWSYVLYSPLDAFTNVSYRYCRNDQCGSADAENTSGQAAKGMPFTPQKTDQAMKDTVTSWAWLGSAGGPLTVPGTGIKSREANFQAGVELMTGYQPSWQHYLGNGFQNIKDIGSNTVMLTPTWHVTRQNPPVFELLTGQDPLWFDMTQIVGQARQKGLAVAIHPILLYGIDPATWWQNSTRDDGWWKTWFAHYRTFILYHADLAAQTGATSLVVGDASLTPALPGGVLADGTPSGVPSDANEQWSQLITTIRVRFNGKLIWMLPDAGSLPVVPDFLKNVDGLYVQLSAPILKTDLYTQSELETGVAALLDGDILKAQEKTNLPIILGLQYPSVSGAAGACSNSAQSSCLSPLSLNRTGVGAPLGELAFKTQADIYAAALVVINQRSWINGFYAVGFNPVVMLRDTTISIRYKPASDLLWYWFPRLIGSQ